MLDRLLNIPYEIEDLLLRTNGSITWEDLSRAVGPEVSMPVIRDYVMGLEGFTYKAVSTKPYLTNAQKAAGALWARHFWIFWRSAAIMKLRIMLVHNDEKVSEKS